MKRLMSECSRFRLGVVVILVLVVGCDASGQQQGDGSGGGDRSGRSTTAVFPVGGAVYPDGYFFVKMNIGQPPKPFNLDIDTGSELTWVQCDAPCVNCPEAARKLHNPRNNVVHCHDPLCDYVPHPASNPCHDPADKCNFEIEYADNCLSAGVVVKDYLSIQFSDGSVLNPFLCFGCGCDQDVQGSSHPPSVDGVLGLAGGKSSIMSQLCRLGIVRNVVGHCFNQKGGGYLFFGDDLVPSTGMIWAPILQDSAETHYAIGPAELIFAEKELVKDELLVILDSGSTYTYLNGHTYRDTLSTITKNIDTTQMKDAPEDKTLPICWKGVHPFEFISDIEEFFQPFTLRMKDSDCTVMEIPPEAYLVISEHGNVCLGILDGSEVGLENLNVLGDISLQSKLVVYDNKKQKIGWMSASCETMPSFETTKMVVDDGSSQKMIEA